MADTFDPTALLTWIKHWVKEHFISKHTDGEIDGNLTVDLLSVTDGTDVTTIAPAGINIFRASGYSYITLQTGSGPNTGPRMYGVPGTEDIRWTNYAASVEYMRLASGMLGVGTATPDDPVVAYKSQASPTRIQANNPHSSGYASFVMREGGTYRAWLEHDNANNWTVLNGNEGTLKLQTSTTDRIVANGSTIVLSPAGASAMTVTAGGDSFSLSDCNTAGRFPFLEWRDGSGVRGLYIGWGSDSTNYLDFYLDNGHALAVSGSSWWSFGNSGGVSIGTGTGPAFGAILDVMGVPVFRGTNDGDGTIYLYADRGDDNADKWRLRVDLSGVFYIQNYATGSWQTAAQWAGHTGAGTAGLVGMDGIYDNTTASSANVYVGADTYLRRSTSSRRYKTNIRDLPDRLGLRLIRNLRPVVYNSICDGDLHDIDYVGLIAEEVHDLGATPLVTYNDEGAPEAVNYDRVVAVLISAVQELDRRNTELAARVAALEARR